ncbi:MAG: tRNA (guanosine(46)-N7)-methyltransferase TrmB [Synergistaceae bacterium]|nr:tRNA (guanosine(46)-N7)-methyltransferase TrmB [Synergistaceae bacterium]
MSEGYGNILSPGALLKLPLDLGAAEKTALEIGFGNGEYTVKWAAANPGALMIGVEVSLSCVARCARRIGKAGLSNLKIICADARFMMKELFADESLDMVIMNFPCPWPKTRHAKRRVTAREFADSLAAVLKMGGVFELATDEEWYAAEVQKTLSGHEALSVSGCDVNFARAVTTKYERKWLEMGKTITRLTVAKTKKFTVERQTWGFYLEEGAAVHVKTGKFLSDLPDGLAFISGASGARGDARWVFKSHYAAGGAGGNPKKFLVETIASDDEFEQRCYLKVVERDGGAMVKLDGTAKVFLTPAVRFAVEDLARRLVNA